MLIRLTFIRRVSDPRCIFVVRSGVGSMQTAQRALSEEDGLNLYSTAGASASPCMPKNSDWGQPGAGDKAPGLAVPEQRQGVQGKVANARNQRPISDCERRRTRELKRSRCLAHATAKAHSLTHIVGFSKASAETSCASKRLRIYSTAKQRET